MKFQSITLASLLITAGCASNSPPDSTASSSDVAALHAQLKSLQDQNALLNLKLQDEIERSTIQLFLTRQEIAVAKRETAALRTKCGAPCTEAAQP